MFGYERAHANELLNRFSVDDFGYGGFAAFVPGAKPRTNAFFMDCSDDLIRQHDHYMSNFTMYDNPSEYSTRQFICRTFSSFLAPIDDATLAPMGAPASDRLSVTALRRFRWRQLELTAVLPSPPDRMSSNGSSSPLVSVGIPVRNGGRWMRSTIEFIPAEDQREVELIISQCVDRPHREHLPRASCVRCGPPAGARKRGCCKMAAGIFLSLIPSANADEMP